MVSLPPPEHEDHVDARFKRHNCYTAEQMQAYGQQCRDAALEEAAVGLETGDVSTFKDDTYMLAYTTHLLIYFAKYFRSLK